MKIMKALSLIVAPLVATLLLATAVIFGIAAYNPISLSAPIGAAITAVYPTLPTVVPDWFKTAADGTDDYPSFNRAKSYLAANGAGCMELLPRTYKLSATFVEDTSGLCLRGSGQGASFLEPTTASQTVIQVTAPNINLQDFGVTDGLAEGGMTCIFVGPTNGATTNSVQDYFYFRNISCRQAAEGVNMRPGGSGSAIYFGQVTGLWCYSRLRTLFLQQGVATGVNGNNFYNINSIDLGGTNVPNSYIDVDGGDGNSFYGGSANGIIHGTSPLTTPTIIRTGTNGTNNKFFGGRFENDSGTAYNLDNNAAGNEFYGQSWANVAFATFHMPTLPDNLICATNSNCPTIQQGYIYEGGSQVSGVPCNACLYVPGSNGVNVVNGITTGKGLIANANPASVWALDVTGSSAVSVTTGSCSSALAAGDGLVVISDVTSGDSIANLTGGGNVVILSSTGTHWNASPSTTPTAGKSSYVFSGGYVICNATGSTDTYIVSGNRVRASN